MAVGGDRYYKERMSNKDVIKAFKAGRYTVDSEGGEIIAKSGKVVASYPGRDGHLFIRLYHNGKRRTLAKAQAVWMAVTGRTVPCGFQVHHRNRDVVDDSFGNLFCLHEIDHGKLHGRDLIEGAAPF